MFGVTSSRSGSDIFSLLSLSGGIWLSLTLAAFIAAIVCTVLLYRKYVSEPGASKVPGAKHDFGPFLRFEKFWSEKILIVLFIYNMCFIAFGSAAAAISLLSTIAYSAAGAFFGVILVAVLFVLGEVSNRLFYEFFMLIVKMWRNTQDIRAAVASSPHSSVSDSKADASHVDSRGAVPRDEDASNAVRLDLSPTSPISPVASASSSPKASNDSSWTCASCGAKNKAGVFCSQCGKRRS